MQRNQNLSHKRLLELLEYFPETGDFAWKYQQGLRGKKGTLAGGNSLKKGYKRISIDKVRYFSHRLAWFYVHEEWPNGEIDHINGNRADNRIE